MHKHYSDQINRSALSGGATKKERATLRYCRKEHITAKDMSQILEITCEDYPVLRVFGCSFPCILTIFFAYDIYVTPTGVIIGKGNVNLVKIMGNQWKGSGSEHLGAPSHCCSSPRGIS